MESVEPTTHYAPAARASAETLRSQYELFQSSAQHRKLFNAVPVLTMALNAERQIVFANQALLDFVGAADALEVCGLRPGELLECSNALDAPSGCGTSERCSACGALEAILSSRLGSPAREAARITCRTPAGTAVLELELWAAPLELGGEQFTILCALDISERVRRQALERLVVRELPQAAGTLRALSRVVETALTPEDRQTVARSILAVSEHMDSAVNACAGIAAAFRPAREGG